MTSIRLPGLVRVVATTLGTLALTAAALAGTAAGGLTVTMRHSHGPVAGTPPGQGWPQPRPVPQGRLVVAVVLGQTGSVVTDVLAPYEILARSGAFHVYTVADQRTPVALTGGLPVLPDHTFAEVESDTALRPDVVVVPAVAEPTGTAEASLRSWVARQAGQGARILGVCAGSHVLAAAGVLDGRRATSFWYRLGSLREDYPSVDWVGGQRYVQDGPVITTAGVTSGVVGALRLVEQHAGVAEAQRIGRAVAYPAWSAGGPTAIDRQHLSLTDLPYALNATFPWARPTIGVGLVDGASEIDIAAVFELYSATSSAARTIPVAARRPITTRHGVVLVPEVADDDPKGDTKPGPPTLDRLIVPGVRDNAGVDRRLTQWAAGRGLSVELPHRDQRQGEFSFDPILRDLAAHTDRATARTTAKFTEYPAGHLELHGSAWPWRPTILVAVAGVLSAGTSLLIIVATRRVVSRARRHRRGGPAANSPAPDPPTDTAPATTADAAEH